MHTKNKKGRQLLPRYLVASAFVVAAVVLGGFARSETLHERKPLIRAAAPHHPPPTEPLAARDLEGKPRARPCPTMGALEVDPPPPGVTYPPPRFGPCAPKRMKNDHPRKNSRHVRP